MATKKAKAVTPPGEIIRLGKDEMNLIEHPFASLWKNEVAESEIYLEWETTHPTLGKAVKASWRVTGDPKMGLPTVSDERVYLVLMELTREAGFTQTVAFTRYDLLKRLNWPDHHKYYQMLKDALTRLSSVNITAENAFWNPRAKSFSTVGFHILENYEIFSEARGRKSKESKEQSRSLPLSYFKWNDIMFQSFLNGNIRSIDLEFALSLERPLTLRLFRYLDKKTNSNRLTFEVSLRELCKLHLGMIVDGRYESDLKASLKPAHAELVKRGFLEAATYQPMKTRKGSKVCYVFHARQKPSTPQAALDAALEVTRAAPKFEEDQHDSQPSQPNQNPSLLKSTSASMDPASQASAQVETIVATLSAIRKETQDIRENLTAPANTLVSASEAASKSEAVSDKAVSEFLLRRILNLKVSPHIARQLLEETPVADLEVQLDCLDDREPRDVAATFVKAVREQWELPASYIQRQQAENRARQTKAYQTSKKIQEAREEAIAREEKASQEEEERHLDAIWETLDPISQRTLENEARQMLGVLGQTGRARGALQAMKRNLLRERLK